MANTTTYLSGGRIQGRSDDFTLASIPQTSWKELGRSTLSSAGDVLDSGTIAAKDNLMILVIGYKSGSASTEKLQFNADTEDNYSERHSENGGSDSTSINQDHIELSIDGEDDEFTVLTVRNIASKEKLVIGHTVARQGGTGTGTAPTRWEVVGKWANTSNQITRVQVTNPYGGDLDTGSEMVVLGMDDDEADSGTNFWQELGAVNQSTNSRSIDTGTITAKKYLLIQANYKYTSGNDPFLQFNSDHASNYLYRRSMDDGADSTTGGQGGFHNNANSNYNFFDDIYVINVSNKEKIGIIHTTHDAGNTGAGTAPSRREYVGKWTNTSDSITSVQYYLDSTGNMQGQLRVWGSN